MQGIMIKMLSVRKMKAILEKLSLLPWLAPYALLAYGYLLLLYKAGFHIPVLLIFSFPILMLIFIFLHSHADMTLDSDCDYDEGLIASIKCFFNCYFFVVFCTLPVFILISGVIYLAT